MLDIVAIGVFWDDYATCRTLAPARGTWILWRVLPFPAARDSLNDAPQASFPRAAAQYTISRRLASEWTIFDRFDFDRSAGRRYHRPTSRGERAYF